MIKLGVKIAYVKMEDQKCGKAAEAGIKTLKSKKWFSQFLMKKSTKMAEFSSVIRTYNGIEDPIWEFDRDKG